ncbi:MAG: acylneuraminate cytidylyltransferase family protein [Verrucomicrobiota bacterium]
MNVVAVITARGGSRGLPRKNILPLAGKPLIAHSITVALQAKRVRRVILSTDDEEIMQVALEHGAEVPFVRPPELSTPDAAHIDVMLHVVQWLEDQGDLPDAVLLLQPTTPLRMPEDLDGAVNLLESTGCPAVVGVGPAESHPYLTYKVDDKGHMVGFVDHGLRYPRRQDLPPAYILNGALYLNRCTSLRETQMFQPPGAHAWIMPPERSVDIDSLEDFALAEALLKKRAESAASSAVA